uniref:Uncharacterized protein n=1 Tax=Rhizophora mucronata TaxID=61149 RepID=A0A2P2MQR1_RHIMU
MAKPSKRPVSSDDALSDGSNSSSEEQVNEQINEDDEEELEAVARSAESEDDDAAEADGEGENAEGNEVDEVIIRSNCWFSGFFFFLFVGFMEEMVRSA